MKLILRFRKILLPAVAKVGTASFLCLAFTGVQAQKPGGVGIPSGLTSWFKANTTGNIVVNAPVNNVSGWTSESGTGITLAQGTTSKQPVFQSNTTASGNFNFNPFVQFITANITNLNRTSASPDLLGTGGTVFLVVNTFPGTSTNPTAFTYMSSSSYRFQVKPGFRMQSGALGFGYTADFYPAVMPPTAPAPSGYILTTKGTGSIYRGRKNADSVALTNKNDAVYNPAVSTGLYLGSNGTSSEPYNGGIAEVITFNTTLNDTLINKVESYLALKYGITLSQSSAYGAINSNYTSADGTIFWTAASNAAYSKCIAGIGRDDSSAVLQKQSKSVHDSSLVFIYNGATGGVFPAANADNTATIASDKSFLMAGDNGLSKNLTACLANGYVSRMARIWKVQKTGTGISTATIAVIKDSVAATVKRLLVSSDPAFPAASSVSYPLTLANGKLYAAVNFNNNDYFTFTTDTLQVTLTPSSPSCTTPTSGSIAAVVTGGNPAYTYLWTPSGQTTANLTSVTTGTYTLTVTQGSCQATASASVVALVPIAAPVVSSSNITVNSITFSWLPIAGATGYQVSVDGGTYTAPSSGTTGTTHVVTGLKPLQTVTISVIALGAQSCQNSAAGTGTAKTLSDAIFIPNVFTPNGDGSNDLFKIYGNSISGIALKIFDQWGELIFEGSDLQKGWDGTYKGKQQPVGVYIYTVKIKLSDGTEVIKKGSVNLVR